MKTKTFLAILYFILSFFIMIIVGIYVNKNQNDPIAILLIGIPACIVSYIAIKYFQRLSKKNN
jgi:hypothetical membrane protein